MTRTRLILIVGAVVVVVAVALVLARRANASGPTEQELASGFPAGNRPSAQRPSGGASNTPGNLPAYLVTQPDTLQEQVQATNASSADVPASLSSASGPSSYLPPGTYVAPGQIGPFQVPGGYATTDPEYNSYIQGFTENVWNVGSVGNFPAQPSLAAVAAGSSTFDPMSDPNYAAAVAANAAVPGGALV